MRSPTALDAALVALAREPGDQQALRAALLAAPPELGATVVDHGLAGVAAARLRPLSPDFAALRSEVDAGRSLAWSRHLTMVNDLAEIAAALDALPGGWALVKGPVLAELAYGRADARSYVDLDVLVHPTSFGDALDRLQAAGAELVDRNWSLIRSTERGELSLLLHGRTPIDLHWHLINEAPLRRRARWSMPDLLSRTTTAAIGGTAVPVLSTTDALMHLAVHACRSGAHRLVWLKDIERVLTTQAPDLAELEQRARAARLWPHVELALTRTASVFGLDLLHRRTTWTRMNAAVGCDGFRTSGSLLSSGRSLAEACRATAAGSVGALGHATIAGWHHGWASRHRPLPGFPALPPTPEDLHREGGTEVDRQTYLAAVQATVRAPR